MAGPTNKLKTVRAKLVGGIITYPGCDPNDPIIWFGSSGYALFNVQKRTYELFYDTSKKTLLRLDSRSCHQIKINICGFFFCNNCHSINLYGKYLQKYIWQGKLIEVFEYTMLEIYQC